MRQCVAFVKTQTRKIPQIERELSASSGTQLIKSPTHIALISYLWAARRARARANISLCATKSQGDNNLVWRACVTLGRCSESKSNIAARIIYFITHDKFITLSYQAARRHEICVCSRRLLLLVGQ